MSSDEVDDAIAKAEAEITVQTLGRVNVKAACASAKAKIEKAIDISTRHVEMLQNSLVELHRSLHRNLGVEPPDAGPASKKQKKG